MEYIIIIVASYLLGSINFSILLGKLLKKIDIRDVNTHNPGASNVTVTLGLKWGVLIFFLDALKGFIPVFVVRVFLQETDMLWFIAGFSALMGHIFPIYYGFKGGKGTSTFIGVIFGVNPFYGLIMLAVIIATTVISNYIIIGTLSLLIPVPIYMILSSDYHWLSITLIIVFIVINIYRHRNNVISLLKGEEITLREGLKGDK